MPFKVVDLPGTVSDPTLYAVRSRRCDLGYLRTPFARADGTIGYRCPAENAENFTIKGGDAAETSGRKCLCNGLLAAVGLGQRGADDFVEPAIVTAGDDIRGIARYLSSGANEYGVDDVLRYAGV